MKLNTNLGLLIVATATMGAGVAVAATTAATDSGGASSTSAPAPGGRHWHGRHGSMLVGMMLHATHQLALTSEQQQAIKTILANAKTLRKGNATVSSVDMSVLGNPGDPNYAAALENAKSLAANRIQRESEVQAQIYNVLTPEQKAKLPQVLADMKAKLAQRRAAWQQEHPAAVPESAGTN